MVRRGTLPILVAVVAGVTRLSASAAFGQLAPLGSAAGHVMLFNGGPRVTAPMGMSFQSADRGMQSVRAEGLQPGSASRSANFLARHFSTARPMSAASSLQWPIQPGQRQFEPPGVSPGARVFPPFLDFPSPYALYGIAWGGGPLWWALRYSGWGIYPADSPAIAEPTAAELQRAANSLARGERAFSAQDFDSALADWEHAAVDAPGNGGIPLLIAQALFALRQFDQAAGAVQLGMRWLDEYQWGEVVTNYRELYADIAAYTRQLRSLEQAVQAEPARAANRFLLGYHYGYLGYPRDALRQLDEALALEPNNAETRALRDRFAGRIAIKRPAERNPVSPSMLEQMGLGRLQPVSNVEGELVRGR